ncbi:MAG: hypothetical protein ACRYHA_19605 [Janthinobacterium lividum]
MLPTPPTPVIREPDALASDARAPAGGGIPDGALRHVTADGVPVFEATYRGGMRQGLLKLYDANGQLLQAAEYLDDLPHGTTTLFIDGHPVCAHRYRRGVLEGETLCYAASGALSARLPYRDGRLHGKALFFQDDQLLRRAHYRAGKLDGTCEDFAASGHPVQSARYRNGALHGPFVRYWPNGKKMEERLYEAGRGVVATRHFDAQGREIGASGATSVREPFADKCVRGVEKWVRGA